MWINRVEELKEEGYCSLESLLRIILESAYQEPEVYDLFGIVASIYNESVLSLMDEYNEYYNNMSKGV